ncbi:hypothetical protein HMPREF1544_04141 [Mucor circinelloides 1006PhL]|uniref:Uncharacterized protein n=1 Tax=Mucor circinelloides f. circinelloides (strain 1006PhL) TaxID=1220926 RepID=S2K1H6_MUCC1|nr:hypothetical protein HMPREF1544_04141 [Mucor circinelloides 1006PhL]
MSVPAALSFECSWPNGACIDNNQVDSWELKASRRVLKNLRTLLAGQPMLDLLKDQMEEADTYYKDIIEKSNGKSKESRIDLKVKEFKCLVFIDTVVPTHPEHYALLENQEGLAETIGEHPARVFVHPCTNASEFVKVYGDPLFQNLPAMGALKDGNNFVCILQDL